MEQGLIIAAAAIGIVLITVVPTLFFVFKMLRGLQQNQAEEQRLLTSGAPASAQIVGVQQTGTYVNRQPEAQIVLTVYPPGGQPYQAQITKIVPLFEIASYQVGAQVAVRYDPASPARVAIVPGGAMPGGAQPPPGGGPWGAGVQR